MLNSNKRSLTLDTKKPEGKEAVLEKLIKESDVLVENFAPGALDRMGFTWEYIQSLNPKMIVASVKGFSDGHHYDDLKVYENVAQCAGGAASTTGFWDGPPTVSAAALGDSNTGMHLAIGILTALIGAADRQGPEGRRVDAGQRAQPVPRQAARPAAPRPPRLPRGVPAVPERHVRRRGAARRQRRRRRPAGLGAQVQGLGDRPERLHLLHDPGPCLGARSAKAIGKPEWVDDPDYKTAKARQPHITQIFATIEEWLKDKTKFEAVDILRKFDIPCAPVLTMKELANDPSLRASGTIVEVRTRSAAPT
jgi:formyl-CoA transferase